MTRSRAYVALLAFAFWLVLFVTMLALQDRHPTALARCLDAANTPGPTGFATEVCEPLMPGYVERGVGVRP